MNILCVGDVVGTSGVNFLADKLSLIKKQYSVDFTIVNGENCHESGVGITRHSCEDLLQYADVVTTGNHSHRRCSEDLYSDIPPLIHPANYPYTEYENGCFVTDTGRNGIIRVINLAGVAWMEPIDSPFKHLDDILSKCDAKYTIIDLHAESTAEKKAIAYYADGRVSAIFGTHTHVQTADEQILPKGTGFISDVGMTGPINSVIGVEPQTAIHRQMYRTPVQMKPAKGPCCLNGAVFTLDDKSGLCQKVERIFIKEEE